MNLIIQSAGDLKLKAYNEIINDFVKDSKDLMIILKLFKKQIKVIVPLKEQELTFYRHFLEFAGKYEDINTKNIKQYGDNTTDLNV